MIELTIMGDPVPQGRPKFSARGGFARAYDPPTSRAYKKLVATQAAIQYHGELLTGPLSCTVIVYRPLQKSGSKRQHARKLSGLVRPVEKGDVDNYFKAVTDPLTGIIWVDDSQIVEAHIAKFYSEDPRVEIKVEQI